jgi:hypothetical protein
MKDIPLDNLNRLAALPNALISQWMADALRHRRRSLMALARDVRPVPMEDGCIRLRVVWRRSRRTAVDQLATHVQPEVVRLRDHRCLIRLLSLRVLAAGQAADEFRVIRSEVVKLIAEPLPGVPRVRDVHGHIEIAAGSFRELRDVPLRQVHTYSLSRLLAMVLRFLPICFGGGFLLSKS